MGNVQLTDVTKRYDDVTAVTKMNLNIEDGEFVTFVGPSGCGKSTTLEMIAGLTKPTEGSIVIEDQDVTTLPPKSRDVAMVFQNIALFPHMDVRDNVSFGLRLRDYPDDEIDERVERATDIVQLEGMLDRMPSELSGGQQQRVAIARSIVREPAVFLMDEPLANLDAKLRIHMRTELQRLHNQLETTIIYVTHDQEEAMTMSDRVAVINEGQLQQIAPPLTCYNEPANRFVAGFIGSPSMNFVEGTVSNEKFESAHVTVTAETPDAAGDEPRDVTLGVRPEDLYLAADREEATTPSDPIEVTVEVLEPMGDEIFVYLTLAGEAGEGMRSSTADQLLMSVEPDSDVAVGQSLSIVADRAKAHLFDGETGEALAHQLVRTTQATSSD